MTGVELLALERQRVRNLVKAGALIAAEVQRKRPQEVAAERKRIAGKLRQIRNEARQDNQEWWREISPLILELEAEHEENDERD